MNKWAILLFLLGVSCLLYAGMISHKQGAEMNQLQTALEEIKDTGKQSDSSLPLEEDVLLGAVQLYIPGIDLDSPVLPETTKEFLNIALTQIKSNQVPGQGNFTIAGHNSAVYGRHFNRLHEVNIGDEIHLIDGEEAFIYEVESKKIIAPSEVDVLHDHPNKKEITLITCTVSGTKRLAVKGKRIS